MIIFYQIPDDSVAKALRQVIEEDKIEHMYVEADRAGATIRAIFAGDDTKVPHQDPSLPIDPAVIFNAQDTSHEDANKFLEKLQSRGVHFGYHIMADDSVMDLPLGDVLIGHRDYQDFLNKLSFLQQMIDGCKALKEESYDPDQWSNLKIAVANANDFLDAIVNDNESEFSDINPKDVDKIMVNLQTAMQKLLNTK